MLRPYEVRELDLAEEAHGAEAAGRATVAVQALDGAYPKRPILSNVAVNVVLTQGAPGHYALIAVSQD